MKMINKKLACMILSVFLLVSALPLTVHAVATTHNVSSAEELSAACADINENGGEHTINLTKDIEGGCIDIDNGDAIVTVIGNGYTLSATISAVNVSNGATVNLGDGNSELFLTSGDNNDDPGIVYVLENSTCNMYDKVTLKDHKGQNYFGGGVTVEGGTFHMYGGTIQNCGIDGGSVCYGGGVAVFYGGTFIMDDGIITDCYIKSCYYDDYDPSRCLTAAGGGVFVTGGSTFTMNGGTISNNIAENTEGMAFGGGVAMAISDSYSNNSEFKKFGIGNPQSNVAINSGTITENKAQCGAGIFASGYFYAFSSAFLWNTPESGVTNNPGLIINGGEISANEAEDAGGGVFVAMLRPAAKVQIHNAEIKSNIADNGAGIENFGYWTQMDIDGCTITGNTASTNGGGVLLSTNSSGGFTSLKNTTVTDNTSGERGAGVYYDANSQLRISGADIIQDNTYNGKLNNLNILSPSKPVYVNGDLTGSQIGLSDPTLWDDDLDDTDPAAVSADYLTSGYKSNNTAAPETLFTSDHDSWIADISDVNEIEVRLVRKTTVDYHINNRTIAKGKYNGNDIFTSNVTEATGKDITVGDTIESFYAIPEITPTAQNSCPYIFKGWYYDKANDNDENPVDFGTDIYEAGRDIYAHWIEVKDVAKDSRDKYTLPEGETAYGGFDLTGVQVRGAINDTNFDGIRKPGGLRFMTSLSMDVVNKIKGLKDGNIEYGYVAATREDWITAHQNHGDKMQYVDSEANGKNTTDSTKPQDYFGFASNVVCTSQIINESNGVVIEDHRNFDKYLLYTLVITYKNGEGYDRNVLARPYIRYTDANGLDRVAYSEYRGRSNTLGGCYTSYNANVEAPEQEG